MCSRGGGWGLGGTWLLQCCMLHPYYTFCLAGIDQQTAFKKYAGV